MVAGDGCHPIPGARSRHPCRLQCCIVGSSKSSIFRERRKRRVCRKRRGASRLRPRPLRYGRCRRRSRSPRRRLKLPRLRRPPRFAMMIRTGRLPRPRFRLRRRSTCARTRPTWPTAPTTWPRKCWRRPSRCSTRCCRTRTIPRTVRAAAPASSPTKQDQFWLKRFVRTPLTLPWRGRVAAHEMSGGVG